MSYIDENETPVTNVYNLLREACGISQADAAEHLHDARLDSVKSWCSDRRTAPQGVINELQRLLRQIHRAGVRYSELLKLGNDSNVYIIGLPTDEEDARACGFPSVGAQLRAIAIAISQLPDDSEIRMTERVRGAIPAPVLEREPIISSEADAAFLASLKFTRDKVYTSGAVDRRKFERLEEIGWVSGSATNLSDVEYTLLREGKAQLALQETMQDIWNDHPNPAPLGMQTTANSGQRRGSTVRLEEHQEYRFGDMSFRIEKVDEGHATVRFPDGGVATLYIPTIG